MTSLVIPPPTPAKFQVDATVLAHRNYRGDYYHLTFHAPEIARAARAGQFVDLLPPNAPHLLLRRPFSIYNVEPDAGTVELIYKTIGAGTEVMSTLREGDRVNLIGPLGNGFPAVPAGSRVLIVAGGYGCAATYLVAKGAPAAAGVEGVVMLGGRNEIDILCDDAFAATGYDVRVATNDGSRGTKGFVTTLLAAELARPDAPVVAAVYACGPNAMLEAVAKLCTPVGVDPALSLDMHMCCGVGACFTCVIKTNAANADGWEYTRTCRNGPVFLASQVHWGK